MGKTLVAATSLVASALALLVVALARLGGEPPVVVACGYVAAVTLPLCMVDLRERLLPNRLVVPGFAFGGASLVWLGLARGSPPWGVLGMCTATMAVFGVLAAFGGVGMGDVKLAGMLALALGAGGLGLGAVGLAVGSAFVAAGIVAVGEMVLMRVPVGRGLWVGRASSVGRVSLAGRVSAGQILSAGHGEIPFGPPLLAGFWVAVAVG
ncbi:prepilin peptidase [Leifsonia poae]|uniref:prepilin peptidase n=1 Tax=Leifsonia poae TaxID=110933 RepID=UPI003D67C937